MILLLTHPLYLTHHNEGLGTGLAGRAGDWYRSARVHRAHVPALPAQLQVQLLGLGSQETRPCICGHITVTILVQLFANQTYGLAVQKFVDQAILRLQKSRQE